MRDDIAAQGSDRARWGRRDSYKPGWGGRSEVAAALTPDGARVLEIGERCMEEGLSSRGELWAGRAGARIRRGPGEGLLRRPARRRRATGSR